MRRLLAALVLMVALVSAPALGAGSTTHHLVVAATAYTTAPDETQSAAPGITAWGDKLKPGMKAIAVSHDLIAMGLRHGTRVRIKGLKGTYVVRDKMNARWERKIDIFMPSKKKAMRWGRRKVTITWTTPTQ